MVVPNTTLVAGDMTGGLDATHEARGGQRVEHVVDRLTGDGGQTCTGESVDGIGIGMRMSMDGIHDDDSGLSDAEAGRPQSISVPRVDGHAPTITAIGAPREVFS